MFLLRLSWMVLPSLCFFSLVLYASHLSVSLCVCLSGLPAWTWTFLSLSTCAPAAKGHWSHSVFLCPPPNTSCGFRLETWPAKHRHFFTDRCHLGEKTPRETRWGRSRPFHTCQFSGFLTQTGMCSPVSPPLFQHPDSSFLFSPFSELLTNQVIQGKTRKTSMKFQLLLSTSLKPPHPELSSSVAWICLSPSLSERSAWHADFYLSK